MKKIILFIASLTLVASCSTLELTPQPLYESYSQYADKTNKTNILQLAPQYFSDNILEKGYETQPYISDFLLFKDSMEKEGDHYEKIMGQRGCLVINGYNDKKEPVIFSLEYVKLSGNWLINFIATIYDEKSFAKEALCPDEYAG